MTRGPRRIVCLTEEPTETLYLLGEDERIVGISGFTVRPPRARREKPKVSAFLSAKIDRILALKPDFAIGFSDLQADIAAQLVRAGVEVWISNHRSVEGILDYIARLGAIVGVPERANALVDDLRRGLDDIAANAPSRRPKVYFEEWDEPMISGIRWVSELVAIAGGDDIFPERAACSLAKDRILANGIDVIARAPDLILGSWCGKKFRPEQVAARPGWEAIPAVRDGELHEIKSPVILQPGPAALTDGVREIARLIRRWVERTPSSPRPLLEGEGDQLLKPSPSRRGLGEDGFQRAGGKNSCRNFTGIASGLPSGSTDRSKSSVSRSATRGSAR